MCGSRYFGSSNETSKLICSTLGFSKSLCSESICSKSLCSESICSKSICSKSICSTLDNSTLDNSTLDNSTLDDSTLDDSTLGVSKELILLLIVLVKLFADSSINAAILSGGKSFVVCILVGFLIKHSSKKGSGLTTIDCLSSISI